MNWLIKYLAKRAIEKRKRKSFIQSQIEQLKTITDTGSLKAACLIILKELHIFGEEHFRKQIFEIQKSIAQHQ